MHFPLTMTRKWLDNHNACDDQVSLFEETWPQGVTVTQEALANAAKAGLDLEWFAEKVLLRFVYANYKAKQGTLYADYKAKFAPLYANYEAKRDTLFADYLANENTLFADYLAKFDPLHADYLAKRDEVLIAALWAAYERKQTTLSE